MKHVALLLAIGWLTTTEAFAQAYDCAPKLDKLASLVGELESISAEVEAREVNDLRADIMSHVEYATTCIGKLPAGPERTRLERRYEVMRRTLKPRVDTAIAKFNEAKLLAHEASKLAARIWNAPAEPDLGPEVAAFERKLDAANNRYLTPAWREPRMAKLRASLDEQRRKQRDGAVAAEIARLATNTVLARHAGKLTRADAARPAKIAEAFALAAASDIVHPIENAGAFVPDPALDTKSVRERPASVRPNVDDDLGVWVYANGRGVGLFLKDYRGPLQKGVPALVWDAGPEDGTLVVVTMDGGRFLVGAHQLRAGLPPAGSWPQQPLYANAVTDQELYALHALGVVSKTAATAKAADQAYSRCTEAIWNTHERDYERIHAANITSETRRNRIAQLETRIYRRIDATCGKHEKSFEKAILGALAEYMRLRANTLATVRARLQSL